MKNFNSALKKVIFCFSISSILLIIIFPEINAQYPGIEESIVKHRKGKLIIRGKPGDKVIV
jgi:hypothetical protein